MSMMVRSPNPDLRRLGLLGVTVIALIATLIARLYYVQVLDKNKPLQTAGQLHNGAIVIPAPRGEILDATGTPLLTNRSTNVITVDGETLRESRDKGAAVLAKLGALLSQKAGALAQQITPCGSKVPAPCWTGEPYQPVPISTNAPTAAVLAISEHREEYPGVTVSTQTIRSYPGATLAAQVLGYAGAVSADDQKTNAKLADADTIGRSGLEEQYDAYLRGVDGTQNVDLDARGYSVGDGVTDQPVAGDTLVTSIDAKLQTLAEKSLADEIAASRAKGKPATSGALVVMDPNSGRILAVASYPTYNPQVFVGGISVADYQALTAANSGDPLVGRAIAGQYAPGSTFKLITSSSLVTNNEISLSGKYPCPGSLSVDGRVKTNYDSESFAYPLTLKQALQVSCDTFFYAPEAAEYYADQTRIAQGQQPTELLQKMAAAYGVGSPVGVDLPADEQASGTYADRETRLARWNANKDQYCKDAAAGYPNETDATQRAYLTELAKENCTDGFRYRAGDNADMAIGQGETTVSPLQLAVAYSAMINGGTLWNPTLGWGIVNSAGSVVKTINPTVKNKIPVSQATLSYIANSLQFENSHSVSGALAFDGAPYKTQIGGKTGTAEVEGHLDTSWLASWGPITKDANGDPRAKYVVVGMVEQAGTGASAAAPMVRAVYDGLLGVGQAPIYASGSPPTTLPTVTASSLASGTRAANDAAAGAATSAASSAASSPAASSTGPSGG